MSQCVHEISYIDHRMLTLQGNLAASDWYVIESDVVGLAIVTFVIEEVWQDKCAMSMS